MNAKFGRFRHRLRNDTLLGPSEGNQYYPVITWSMPHVIILYLIIIYNVTLILI